MFARSGAMHKWAAEPRTAQAFGDALRAFYTPTTLTAPPGHGLIKVVGACPCTNTRVVHSPRVQLTVGQKTLDKEGAMQYFKSACSCVF